MKNLDTNFHIERRAFIIMPGVGLLIAAEKSDISHKQMFENLRLDFHTVQKYMIEYPRGYFMNGELCVYQGNSMKIGDVWKLRKNNYKTFIEYIPDLSKIFNINDETPLYTGVRVGEIGTVWEKLFKTNIKNFIKENSK